MAENTLGRNQVFAIKNADGTPFHDLVLHKATYDSVVMSLGDKITGDVYYKDNRLDVTMNEYIEFKRDPDDSNEEPVKFVLVSHPTIIKEGIVSENSELKGTTKYSFEFYHPMYKLGNMPLTDIAVTSSEENYLSQNKTFSWCGTGNDFIAKLNANLSYSEWVVVASTNAQSTERLAMMPSDVPTKKAGEQAKSNVLSFDKNTIADGLKTIYETWDIPFIVDTLHQGEYYDTNGNDYYSIAGGSKRFVVVVGMPSNEIIDTESLGTVVEATLLTNNNIYYSPQPINVRKGKKIVLESLTEGATPIILNSSHNGVIGTTSRTFEADMTIYVGLYTESGFVRYIYDGGDESIFVFRYGQEVGLKNNSRTPRNNKIITRISASGSEDNIPYGYPQIQWTGNQDWDYTINNASGMQTITVGGRTIQALSYPIYDGIVGGQKVRLIKHPFTRTRLMPSVYVESVNKKVNPNHPQYDPDIELVDYYDADNTYENPIVASSPSYEIHEFDGIKPELDSTRQIAIQGAIPLNDDLTPADSWVDDLKQDTDEYAQSFFRITLPPLGFDVYACASITQQMQINMRSGACIGCTFEIQVDWDDYKVNFYDSDGNFDPAIGTGHPRDAQKYPNSTSSSINVVVKKETSTFGTLMPNIYQQPTSGDLFVILGISLPASYIIEAQQRLDNTAKQYMRENNLHYFDYPLKFDEYFLAKHPSILRQIRTNTIVRFDYAGQILHLCVKQITIKFGEKALPQYNITLTDNIEVVLNPISQIANDVNRISTMAYQNAKQTGSGGSGNAQDKLSKVYDDTANGLITFLKGIKIGLQRLFGWDAEGNITANDVNVGGLLTSMRAKINELFSSNYSGSGIFESGWLLTNNHNGHSYLEIDELLVRMKAVFMELEIRKETYSGGNVFYSPAGSIIYRVEPQNASNEPLGQRTIETVRPWSWSRRFLGLFGLSKIGLFSHKQIVKIQDDVDPLLVHHYRCYLIADDGTVQTRNWWHDNDQARCQTFNRASEKHNTNQSDQTNPNFDDNYVQRNMDGNRFFWRLVTNVGSTRLEDGKWYDYVDLDNFTPDVGYVRGSDVPVAGDSIVCIGNRVEEERMNMIMLEVIGDDAPAIKIYKGINSFSFDGRKYMNVSPKKIQLRSGSIEYISDNGQILPPKMSRGAWVSGVRYHYYDEVSHSGSTWLCIIIDGYRWEDAQGNIIENESLIGEIRAGEGLFVYGTDSHGEDLKDRYYSIGTYNGAPAYKVRKYTINEPSDLHAAEWQKEVSAGGSGVRGSFKSRVFARTNTNIATEYYTPTGGDYEHPWPGGENPHTHNGVTWHDGVPAGKEILWSSVCTFYGAGGSSGWSIPSPETDTADLDIEFSPSATKPLPPMTGANDTPPTTPVGTKINGDNTHGSRANGSGSEADWYDTQKDANNTHADWENARWRAERKISNGAYDGEWVITKIKGEDGDGIPGDFKSTAFIRTNVDISNVTPTGGTYSEPWPTSTDGGASWSDGIPSGDAMLWASNCTFYGDGTKSGWDNPRKMMDTQDYDVEFAFEQDPDIQPAEPNDYNRHGSANQIWFDPILDNPLPAGTSGTWSDMVWRAERETINGEVGAWVITRIKGEKGEIDPSQIPQEWIDEVIDQASKALQEGLSIIISPQVIFVRQDTEGDVVFNNATADVEVYKSDVLQQFSIPSGQLVTDTIKAFGKTDTGYIEMQNYASAEAVSNDPNHPTANTLWRVKLTGIEKTLDQQSGEYDYAYDNGYIRFKVNVTVVTDDTTTPPTTTTKSYWIKVAWYLNRLGNRTTKMWGDIEQTYMSRTEYSLADLEKDQTVNLLRGTQNPQIGSTTDLNDLWSNDNSQDLTIETLTESPVSGYNKAFHIESLSARFSQVGKFWKGMDTYKFSAFIRGVGGSATATVEVEQPNLLGGFARSINVGTKWECVTFPFNLSNFNNLVDGLFYIGSSSGTVEFLAPTVVDITSPSVIRTDYEGQIQTSASGLDTKFTAITNSLDGRIDANTSNISTLSQTASGLTSRVVSVEGDISTLGGDLDDLEDIVQEQGGSISTIQQTSDSISLKVSNTVKENLIMNGTFEGSSGTVPQYWENIGSNVSINTSYTYHGHNSVCIDHSTYDGYGIEQTLWYHSSANSENNIERVVSGEWHILKFAARRYPDTSEGRLAVFFNTNITTDYTSNRPFIVELTDSWREYTLRFKAKDQIAVTDENLYVIFRSWDDDEGDFAKLLLSEVSMTARMDNMLKETGIDITSGEIELKADKVTFSDSQGGNTDKIFIDPENGTLHAENGVFTGSLLFHKVVRSSIDYSVRGAELFTYDSTTGKYTLDSDYFILTGAKRTSGFTVYFPPASRFPKASIKIIDATFSGGNGSPAQRDISPMQFDVVHHGAEQADDDAWGYVKNTFTTAIPFTMIDGSQIVGAPNSGSSYITSDLGIVFDGYGYIELVSCYNPFVGDGESYYAWMIVDAR